MTTGKSVCRRAYAARADTASHSVHRLVFDDHSLMAIRPSKSRSHAHHRPPLRVEHPLACADAAACRRSRRRVCGGGGGGGGGGGPSRSAGEGKDVDEEVVRLTHAALPVERVHEIERYRNQFAQHCLVAREAGIDMGVGTAECAISTATWLIWPHLADRISMMIVEEAIEETHAALEAHIDNMIRCEVGVG
mmetsp:Transcript_93883/g.238956  ORF Transcript_93883/g.238956 Transcript_93883/m.238956 type:complete len:192 (+) Transcript_93883:109-684(+)